MGCEKSLLIWLSNIVNAETQRRGDARRRQDRNSFLQLFNAFSSRVLAPLRLSVKCFRKKDLCAVGQGILKVLVSAEEVNAETQRRGRRKKKTR